MDVKRAIEHLNSLKLHCERMANDSLTDETSIFWEHDAKAIGIALQQIELNRDLIHAIEIIKKIFGVYPKFDELPHNLKAAVLHVVDVMEGKEVVKRWWNR